MEITKLTKFEERWQKNYELLKEYVEAKNCLPTARTEYKGVKLGIWINNQKQAWNKGNLTDKYENMLRSVGIDFDTKINEKRWLENYDLLKEYIEEKGALPNKSTEYKGTKLGRWFIHQKQADKAGNLSHSHKNLLRSIGVVLNVSTREKRWLKNYELLKEYISINGLLLREQTEYKGVKLGSWVRRQKRDYREGNLLSDRETMLNSIGLKLNVSTQPKRWLYNYELLKEYVTAEGVLPATKTEYKGIRLGRWLLYQKQAYDDGKLSDERKNMLKAAGVELDVDGNERRWLNNYELLKEYITTKGVLPATRTEYKGVNLGVWLLYQKQTYDKGNLSSSRENMLRFAGVEL